MTAIHRPRRILSAPSPGRTDRSRHALTPGAPTRPLGPFATVFASGYLTLAFILAGPAYPFEPYVWTLSLAFPFGAMMLAPREHTKRMVIDGPILLMAAWVALSVLWTYNPEFGVFSVRRDVPLWITASLMASLLPKEEAIAAAKRGLTIGILISIVALILIPETRTRVSESVYLDDIPGWHGFFVHKNTFSPFLVYGLILSLNFERDAIRRGIQLAVIAVLLVGSDSATGISAALFVGATYAWFRVFHRTQGRRSTAFVVSTLAVGLVALMGAIASLSTIISAYGKDLTFSGRTFIWQAVINAIADRPFVGYGVGGVFWDQNSAITRQIWRETGFAIPHSHSGALDVWLNYGLVGLALFAVLFVSSLSKAVRLLRRSPQIGEWLATLLAAQFLMGLSENVFLGAWIVYIGVVRAIAQRELNDVTRAGDGDRRPVPTPTAALLGPHDPDPPPPNGQATASSTDTRE